jgi:adenylate kinase
MVLFGPPGAGKGTQSANIIEKYKLIHIATGDLLRSEIAAGTELGKKAEGLMKQGLLVPDDVVIGMIKSKFAENRNANGFVFDGFPRTIEQAKALDQLLNENKTPIRGVVALEVSENVLIERILERGKTSGRPDDQDRKLVEKRVVEYRSKTEPVANFYAQQGKLKRINGIGGIDEIFKNISVAIDSFA